MTTDYEIFRNKRVLITGDTGFKGSWLAYWLHHLGAKVYGFALPPERDCDHFTALNLEKLIHHHNGDVREYSQVRDFMKKIQPEFVFHLAAQPLVRKSYNEPKLTFDTNVGGSVNIFEGARVTPSIKALIMITSDKCYKNKEWCWGYRENDELGGKDPYSASKAAAELVYSAYRDSFFNGRTHLGAASVRAGNVIGGGDWSTDRIVPDCIRALENNKPIELRNPHATRPWQHVMEPLSGYLHLASRIYENPKQFSGSYNFGPEGREMHTVHDLAEELVAAWGSGKIKITKHDGNLHEAGLLHLNCDKAHHELNWYPKWGFKKTVEQTAKWYKSVKEGESARSITKQQIIEYMES
ncbi:MAG: CDP-glucose 4,6-dehydratase [Methanospirillum sp.]|uniref:CDP-glucose 4,6-dehydratase n=1 Tax=Methanospirillum sp. TaxID=45200 RepID=UPI00236BC3AA|nr:CDP-glucose 4,6-dehydratase [Methanospirillum sp.]MDD1729112.1 CDP-glucose 4,6-dehydratase [Methanospirillum sp.]